MSLSEDGKAAAQVAVYQILSELRELPAKEELAHATA
jgi:hypothetical protein